MKIQHRAKRIATQKRIECELRNMPFDLTYEWVLEKLYSGCELTGLDFKLDSKGGHHPYSPSIDRINPHGGYLMDNCRMILLGLNMMKCRETDDVIYNIAEALFNKVKKNHDWRTEVYRFLTNRQADITIKKLDGNSLTKTEGEYFSRVIKKKLKHLKETGITWAGSLLREINR